MTDKPIDAPKYVRLSTIRKGTVVINSFIGGIAWGIGSVVGATFIIVIIGLWISRAESIPFLGDITERVLEQIDEGQEAFRERFNTDDLGVSEEESQKEETEMEETLETSSESSSSTSS